MRTQLRFDGEGRAYLYEAKVDEIKLGGCGMAVVALTEYMDAFQNDKYTAVCRALGELVWTTMPSFTGLLQAVTMARSPSTSTQHTRQAAISLMSFR